MGEMERRTFLGAIAAGGALPLTTVGGADDAKKAVQATPIAISSDNGLPAIKKAVELIKAGFDPLDAAIEGIVLIEDDPEDETVGLGGLPNEEGVVELDCALMHGPTARGGAVASLRNIKNPSRVAKLVMDRTDHALLVGNGALRFARAHGFKEENLLTEASRKKWLAWKERLSEEDDWVAPPRRKKSEQASLSRRDRPTGTVHLSVRTPAGDLACITSTSGLAYKIPGRVGDSPIFGAGLYCDNDVGSAGSTGRGEANLLSCSSVFIVERMRAGRTPEEACLDACKRIADKTREPRLLMAKGKPNFQVKFYAIDKAGRFGSAAIFKGARFTLFDGQTARIADSAYLFPESVK